MLVMATLQARPSAKPAVVVTGKKFVDRNEPIHLKCNATGGSKIPEDVDWFKDGTKIDAKTMEHPNIVLTKYMALEDQALISELYIEHTDIDDSGNYICRSSDREIGNLKVTVLVAADTTNVKRGTGAQKDEKEENGAMRLTGVSWSLLFVMILLPSVCLRQIL